MAESHTSFFYGILISKTNYCDFVTLKNDTHLKNK